MNSAITKKINKSDILAEEQRAAIYVQSPYFIEKKKQAEAFLKKVGLPKKYASNITNYSSNKNSSL